MAHAPRTRLDMFYAWEMNCKIIDMHVSQAQDILEDQFGPHNATAEEFDHFYMGYYATPDRSDLVSIQLSNTL